MIDDIDASSSTLRMLLSQALKTWKIEALHNLLSDDDHVVRTAVARELHMRGEEKTFQKSKELANDKKKYLREIAAFTLGQLGTPDYPYREQSIPILMILLKDRSAEVRAAAVAGLGHLCYENMPQDVEESIILLSNDKNTVVRECTAYALGNSSGDAQSIRTLDKLLNDNDEGVRSYAKLGMEIIKDRLTRTPK